MSRLDVPQWRALQRLLEEARPDSGYVFEDSLLEVIPMSTPSALLTAREVEERVAKIHHWIDQYARNAPREQWDDILEKILRWHPRSVLAGAPLRGRSP